MSEIKYEIRKGVSDDIDFVRKTGNRVIKKELEDRLGVEDALHPSVEMEHGLSPFQKAHAHQLEFEHIIGGNHQPSIGLAYNGRPYCTKCDIHGSENPFEEGDEWGKGVAHVRAIPKKCGTCGNDIHIDDPIAGTWKHDPGYGGPARKFDLGKSQTLDADHEAVMPLPPKE